MWKYNPFKPNAIVGPGMFSGRVQELQDLDRGIFQTKNGNPWHFLIHGERGIGKSSLMLYADMIAQGTISAWHGQKYAFITVKVELDQSTSYTNIIEKVGSELSRELRDLSCVKKAATNAWDFLKRWEVCGIKYSGSTDSEQASVSIEDLCDVFVSTMKTLESSYDGIILLIDEADKPSAESRLGEFIKVFTERLTRRRCNNVAIGLSGISNVVSHLKQSHESSGRILNHIRLEPLLTEERMEVIQKGIEESNKKSETQTSIDPEAAAWIAAMSEGYPHLLQQYAYSAFETDTDNMISKEDAHFGAHKENGALDQLGVRYFEDMYRGQIDSDEYRKVLQYMSEHPGEYVLRKKIMEATQLKATTLNNALSALAKKRIILKSPDKRGLYKLPTSSFGAWIRAQTRRDQERKARQEIERGRRE